MRYGPNKSQNQNCNIVKGEEVREYKYMLIIVDVNGGQWVQ